MSAEPSPLVILPPSSLPELGPLVVVEGECAYFPDQRPSRTAFALPEWLDGSTYQRAMDQGMRRSGTVVYRPLCEGCRKCIPLRVPVDEYAPSRSQRRVERRCEGLFDVRVGPPQLDDERLALYRRYQRFQHGEQAQASDGTSYRRFLVETVTDTVELVWRDAAGTLVAVGVLDVTPDALSSVYFYWEPSLAHLSLGVYSALIEIELCRRWQKRWYYLGYLVPGAKTMNYKAAFPGAEVWTGAAWASLGGRSVDEALPAEVLAAAEQRATDADRGRFELEAAAGLLSLPVVGEGGPK
ncbi:MAG: arginyltransferase [Myxococcota bacterium]